MLTKMTAAASAGGMLRHHCAGPGTTPLWGTTAAVVSEKCHCQTTHTCESMCSWGGQARNRPGCLGCCIQQPVKRAQHLDIGFCQVHGPTHLAKQQHLQTTQLASLKAAYVSSSSSHPPSTTHKRTHTQLRVHACVRQSSSDLNHNQLTPAVMQTHTPCSVAATTIERQRSEPLQQLQMVLSNGPHFVPQSDWSCGAVITQAPHAGNANIKQPATWPMIGRTCIGDCCCCCCLRVC